MSEAMDATYVAAARLAVAVRDGDEVTISEITGSGCDLTALSVWLCRMLYAQQRVHAPHDVDRLDRQLAYELRWAGVAA